MPSLAAGRHPRFELGPQIGWNLHRQIAHRVRQAALTRRAREALREFDNVKQRPVASWKMAAAREQPNGRVPDPIGTFEMTT
jgi:hypothetical protein